MAIKLNIFYTIFASKFPDCLYKTIPINNRVYSAIYTHTPRYYSNEFFKKIFFSSTISEEQLGLKNPKF